MDAALVARCKETMSDNSLQPYAKLSKLVSDLKDGGLCHEVILRPCDLLIHPHNRGASMCNPHDVHERGAHLEKIGIRKSLLTDSFCIEVSPEEPARTSQFQANRNLVASSEGLLAPVLGTERLLACICALTLLDMLGFLMFVSFSTCN